MVLEVTWLPTVHVCLPHEDLPEVISLSELPQLCRYCRKWYLMPLTFLPSLQLIVHLQSGYSGMLIVP